MKDFLGDWLEKNDPVLFIAKKRMMGGVVADFTDHKVRIEFTALGKTMFKLVNPMDVIKV